MGSLGPGRQTFVTVLSAAGKFCELRQGRHQNHAILRTYSSKTQQWWPPTGAIRGMFVTGTSLSGHTGVSSGFPSPFWPLAHTCIAPCDKVCDCHPVAQVLLSQTQHTLACDPNQGDRGGGHSHTASVGRVEGGHVFEDTHEDTHRSLCTQIAEPMRNAWRVRNELQLFVRNTTHFFQG